MTDFYYGSWSPNNISLNDLEDMAYNDDYEYRPDFFFNQEPYESKQNFYGIELEVCTPLYKPRGAFRILKHLNRNQRNFYIKRDGSVSRGFEVNSHPSTIAYFEKNFTKEKWHKAVEDAELYADRSCGYHVHMDRGNFKSDLSVKRMYDYFTVLRPLIMTMSNRVTYSQITRYASYFPIGSRDSYGEASKIAKDYVDANLKTLKHIKTVNNKLSKYELDFMSKNLETHSRNTRYSALNSTNHNTIEARIFGGTVDHDNIMNVLYFLEHLTQLANSNVSVFNVLEFLSTVEPTNKCYDYVMSNYNRMLKQMRLYNVLSASGKLVYLDDHLMYRISVSSAKDDDFVVTLAESSLFNLVNKRMDESLSSWLQSYVTVRTYGLRNLLRNSKTKPVMVFRCLPAYLQDLRNEEDFYNSTLNCVISYAKSFYSGMSIQSLENMLGSLRTSPLFYNLGFAIISKLWGGNVESGQMREAEVVSYGRTYTHPTTIDLGLLSDPIIDSSDSSVSCNPRPLAEMLREWREQLEHIAYDPYGGGDEE